MTSTHPSMMLWERSGLGASNARLEEPLVRFLKSATREPASHSRFLNMLALLEHIGSRKIMLSQMHNRIDKDVLKHVAEETRHAFFFKHQAERLAGHALEGFEPAATLCASEAKMYFGRLDAGINRLANNSLPSRAVYLWVSFIVEIRAAWVYPLYQTALENSGATLSLKSVIAEEEKHLYDMEEELRAEGAMNDLLLARAADMETKLFSRLLDALVLEAAPLPQARRAGMPAS